jgi:hypothetical protein
VVLAELAQVKISARGPTSAGLRTAWARCLDGLDRASIDAVAAALKPDEGAFLLSMLAATHEQRSDPARRPDLETSYGRHEDVVRTLGDLGAERGWPLSWHALWRLPPGMKDGGVGQEACVRYPAVSLVVAVKAIGRPAHEPLSAASR